MHSVFLLSNKSKVLHTFASCNENRKRIHFVCPDEDYYYTAAGNANGDATIYAKNQLICSDYFYIFNSVKTPFK